MTTENCSIELDKKHKETVDSYFSETARYWKNVYTEPAGSRVLFDNYSMITRKSVVLSSFDNLAKAGSLSVLDVGCGPGVIMEEIVKRGHKVTGVDLSKTMIKEAKLRLKNYPGDAYQFLNADIEKLPLESNSFDAVLALGVLPYLQDDKQALSEISRVLKPGGFVLLVLPNMARLNTILDPYYLYRGWHYLTGRLSQPRASKVKSWQSEDFSNNNNFRNRRYLYGGIERRFIKHQLSTTAIHGVDYGPLSFAGKEFLPVPLSIKLSSNLNQLSKRSWLKWVKVLASQWVICLEKL